MITENFKDEQISNFIDCFLLIRYPTYYYKDYDFYHGELLTVAYKAQKRYNPELAQFNTYLTSAFIKRVITLAGIEKDWYEHHIVTCLDEITNRNFSVYKLVELKELAGIVDKSTLTKRTKEILMAYITKPYKTFEDLGRDYGISKQAVSIHIESGRQFFERRSVTI